MRYIGIIILLVLCLTLLSLTGCIVNTVNAETASGNLEIQENTEEPLMWSGLGMVIPQTGSNEQYDSGVDILLDNGFTEFRETPTQDTSWLASSKAAIIRNVSEGAKYIWGVGAPTPITSTNWATFRTAILDAAQWAQNNGVFEFQLGNEEEYHVDGTTMTVAQLITNLKSVATEVQEIFTNGNVSYTCFHENIDDWVTVGKGDIDILAANVYAQWGEGNPNPWKAEIDALVAGFGTDGSYLSEFGPNSTSLDDYSEDEAVQAAGVTEMIDYIKASGMTRAFYFLWYHPTLEMGVLKNDGTYRLLWNQALLNSGSVKSTTVPTTTTTISLPDTIALIPKITR